MNAAVATVLDRIAAEYPGVSVRELKLEETFHLERDPLRRRVREREGAFLHATSVNDFVVDEGGTVEEMAEIAVEALRGFGVIHGSVALSLRFEHSKAANSWRPNTLHGVMVVRTSHEERGCCPRFYPRVMAFDMNPLRVGGDGGPGYCYDTDRDLFRGAAGLLDGPLLVALDSNILFDLQNHGEAILGEAPIEGVDDGFRAELEALGAILDRWMVRDIRFIVVPRTRKDYRKEPSEQRQVERELLFGRIESALTFQAQDWAEEHRRFRRPRPVTPQARSVLRAAPPLDGKMLESSWSAGVDVFLTRDLKVVQVAGSAAAPFPLVVTPTQLDQRLDALGSDLFFCGRMEHPGCESAGEFPLGDTGKWGPLLDAMAGSN